LLCGRCLPQLQGRRTSFFWRLLVHRFVVNS
jgi:hypothetical protein